MSRINNLYINSFSNMSDSRVLRVGLVLQVITLLSIFMFGGLGLYATQSNYSIENLKMNKKLNGYSEITPIAAYGNPSPDPIKKSDYNVCTANTSDTTKNIIDIYDLVIVASAIGQQAPTAAKGDMNEDGQFTVADLEIMRLFYNDPVPQSCDPTNYANNPLAKTIQAFDTGDYKIVANGHVGFIAPDNEPDFLNYTYDNFYVREGTVIMMQDMGHTSPNNTIFTYGDYIYDIEENLKQYIKISHKHEMYTYMKDILERSLVLMDLINDTKAGKVAWMSSDTSDTQWSARWNIQGIGYNTKTPVDVRVTIDPSSGYIRKSEFNFGNNTWQEIYYQIEKEPNLKPTPPGPSYKEFFI